MQYDWTGPVGMHATLTDIERLSFIWIEYEWRLFYVLDFLDDG